MSITAIVLAAGLSSRMGQENKLLLSINGKSILDHVLDHILKTNVEEVILVFGHESHLFKHYYHNTKLKCIQNPNYNKGMGSSIKLGVKNCSAPNFMICLADMPFLKTDEYQELLDGHSQAQLPITLPICNGEFRNPVVFGEIMKTQLLNIQDAEGARSIILSNQELINTIEFKNELSFRDIDTPEEYRQLKLSMN